MVPGVGSQTPEASLLRIFRNHSIARVLFLCHSIVLFPLNGSNLQLLTIAPFSCWIQGYNMYRAELDLEVVRAHMDSLQDNGNKSIIKAQHVSDTMRRRYTAFNFVELQSS